MRRLNPRNPLLRSIPITDQLIAGPIGMVHDHWFRTAYDHPTADRCPYKDAAVDAQECGRPGAAHLRWVGEWRDDRRTRWTAMFRRITNPPPGEERTIHLMPTITDEALTERIDQHLAVDRGLTAAEQGVFKERILLGADQPADWLAGADDSDYLCGDLEKWWLLSGQKVLDYLLVRFELPEILTRQIITSAWYASIAIGNAEIDRRRPLVEIASAGALYARGYADALGWYPTYAPAGDPK